MQTIKSGQIVVCVVQHPHGKQSPDIIRGTLAKLVKEKAGDIEIKAHPRIPKAVMYLGTVEQEKEIQDYINRHFDKPKRALVIPFFPTYARAGSTAHAYIKPNAIPNGRHH